MDLFDATWKDLDSRLQGASVLRHCIDRTNWEHLSLRASSLKQGMPCSMLPKLKHGLHHLARPLQFTDGTVWVARVQMQESTQETAYILQSEVDTMTLACEEAGIPVPKVYAYEAWSSKSANAAFILMGHLPGNVATDEGGGYAAHRGRIPVERQPSFHRAVAQIQVQMTSVRFPSIGMISRDTNGRYIVGPIPHIGGPFSKASVFLTAWAKHAKFPLSADAVENIPSSSTRLRILRSIEMFPEAIALSSSRLITHDNGPFPLAHTDFFHSNLVVDFKYNVQGEIDWRARLLYRGNY